MADRTYRTKTETKEVISKDKDKNVKGKGNVTLYSEDKKGHDACLQKIGHAELMWHYNRQATSQVLNVNRREADEITKINREAKATRSKLDDDNKVSMDAELKAVKEKYDKIAAEKAAASK